LIHLLFTLLLQDKELIEWIKILSLKYEVLDEEKIRLQSSQEDLPHILNLTNVTLKLNDYIAEIGQEVWALREVKDPFIKLLLSNLSSHNIFVVSFDPWLSLDFSFIIFMHHFCVKLFSLDL
jgi:hypothetical protein